MALRERAALAVLARQADVTAFLQQRAERQRLTGRPVDPDAGVDRFRAVVEEPLDGAVNAEIIRHPGDLAADLLEDSDIDAGDAAPRILVLIGMLAAPPSVPSSQSALFGL